MQNTLSTTANFSIHRLEHEVTGDDFVLMKFGRTGGRSPGTLIEALSVASNSKRLNDALLDAGADLPLRTAEGADISNPVAHLPASAGVLAATPGWKGQLPNSFFVLPTGNVGSTDTVTVLEKDASKHCLARAVAGSLLEWKGQVAGLAIRSPAASVAILVALAAPIFRFSALSEGFILNIAGNGSSGKTAANSAAASVWGNPEDIEKWDNSLRGLIERAAANNDMCLMLDDVEKADQNSDLRYKKVNDLIHLITSGSSRGYSKIVSGNDQLPDLKFKTLVLSSSPKSVEAALRARGMSRSDGDRVRLLEICVAHGDKGGIWLGHDGEKAEADTAGLSDRLYAASQSNYGVAGQAFVKYLVAHQSSIRADVAKHREAFLQLLGGKLGSVESRIASKVALLYAAGRLARKAGVIDWKKEELTASTQNAFRSIIESSRLSMPSARTIRPFAVPFGDRSLYPWVEGRLSEFDLPQNVHGCFHRPSNRILMRMSSMDIHLDYAWGGPFPPAYHAKIFPMAVAQGLLVAGDGNQPTKTFRFQKGKLRMLVFDLDARIKAAQGQLLSEAQPQARHSGT